MRSWCNLQKRPITRSICLKLHLVQELNAIHWWDSRFKEILHWRHNKSQLLYPWLDNHCWLWFRSFHGDLILPCILLSASVNSISSMPSLVYQCKNAFLLNMAVNCTETLLNSSWMAVELPMNVAAILRPRGGMSHTAVLTLLGTHSTK